MPVELLREGVNALEPVASLDARYETVYARLDGLCYEVEDAARDLRDLREDMDYDGEEAERVESRLDLLRMRMGGSVSVFLRRLHGKPSARFCASNR